MDSLPGYDAWKTTPPDDEPGTWFRCDTCKQDIAEEDTCDGICECGGELELITCAQCGNPTLRRGEYCSRDCYRAAMSDYA